MTDLKCEIAKAAGFRGVPECGSCPFARHLLGSSEPAVQAVGTDAASEAVGWAR